MIHEDRILRMLVEKGLIREDQIPSHEEARSVAGQTKAQETWGPRVEHLVHQGIVQANVLHELLMQAKPEEYESDHMPTDGLFLEKEGEEEPFGELSLDQFGKKDSVPSDVFVEADSTPTGFLSDEEIQSASSGARPDSGKLSDSTRKPSSRLRISQELITKHMKEKPLAPTELPVKDWDRYIFVKFLGEGGMGKIYKAYDPLLRRYVALKFIRGEDPELGRRFLQEAQAQARVEHNNVCKVYEVGEVEDKLYIAMQFIEGETLSKAKKSMDLRQRLKVMKDVAEGVHAANRIGLIHRDLKPANIMVEKREEGYHPYVLDFGLARDVEPSGMTQTGIILGTPWYMSPEQAMGHTSLDRKTDVYSLGATLYDVLLGKPPFQGSSGMEVVLKVIKEDPEAPRSINPALPSDVETIVMKAMEKEPERRYESGRALAEDLQRFLDDEPILARPATLTYKLTKKAKKYKAVVVAAVIALFLLAGLGINNVHTWMRGKERTRVATRFAGEVKSTESVLRLAYMLPLHDATTDRDDLRHHIGRLEKEMQSLGDIAVGSGNYSLGRAALTLRQPEAARNRLQIAWDNGYRDSDAAYALGRALGEIYQIKLSKAGRIQDEDVRKTVVAELRREYRDEAIRYLSLGQDAEWDSPQYVQALLTFYEIEPPTPAVLQKAKSAQQSPSPKWLYESKKLEGDIYRAMAAENRDQGRKEEALALYQKAEAAYQETVNMARSDVIGYLGLCDMWNDRLFYNLEYGEEPKPVFDKSVEACGKALATDPKSTRAHDLTSEAYLLYSRYMLDHGEDPAEQLAKSAEHANATLKIDPNFGDGHYRLAEVSYVQALNGLYSGQDPTELLNQSVDSYKKALNEDPGNEDKLINLGNSWSLLAEYQMSIGQDGEKPRSEAVAAYQEAIKKNPKLPEPYRNIGKHYWMKGQYEMSTGKDPTATLNEGIRNLQLALQVNPNYALAHLDLGISLYFLGTYEMNHGVDPRKSLEQAVTSYKKAIEANPDNADTYLNIGEVERQLVRYAVLSGSDPAREASDALKNYEKAAEINPDIAEPHSNRGAVFSHLAELNWMLAQDPEQNARKAAEEFSKAQQLNPNYFEAYTFQSDALWAAGAYKMSKQVSPLPLCEQAKAALTKALEIQPGAADALWRMGRIRLLEAEWKAHNGGTAAGEFDAARKALDDAIKSNPEDANAYLVLADYCRKRSEASGAQGSKIRDEGVAAADSALSKNPLLAEALAVKGALHLDIALSQPDAEARKKKASEAADELKKAIGMNRHLQNRYQPMVERAEGVAEGSFDKAI